MENSVSQRLISVIDHFAEGNEKKFAESIGVKPAVINNYTKGKQQSKPGFEVLNKICETYPSINIEWLISGKGTMLKSGSLRVQPMVSEKIIVSTQDTSGNVTVPLINRKAAANYLTGYQTQEYFEELDAINLPGTFLKGTQYYALHVMGDSMTPTLHDGDIVICAMCESGDWDLLQDGDVCVLVSESRGLQIKRIKNRLKSSGYLVCQSDNRAHLPFNMMHDEIVQIWKVNWKLSSHLLSEGEDLYSRLSELEERVEKIERLNMR